MIDKNENSWKLLLLIPTMSLRPLKRRGKRELNRSVTNGMDCYRSTCPIYPWRPIPETINREMRRYVYPQWRTVPCCKNPYRQRSIAPANDETVTWTGPSNTPSDQAHKDDTTCWWNRCCHEEISCGQAYSKFSKKILCWTGGMNILEHILASNKQTCDGLFNVCNVAFLQRQQCHALLSAARLIALPKSNGAVPPLCMIREILRRLTAAIIWFESKDAFQGQFRKFSPNYAAWSSHKRGSWTAYAPYSSPPGTSSHSDWTVLKRLIQFKERI